MTKELFAAKACSQVWKVIQPSAFLTKLEMNVSGFWDKSRLVVHPYVQLDRGFVFIHVPKTAGTSLTRALGLKPQTSLPMHSCARDVMYFLKRIAPHLISIAFVRNPYDRFVSLYSYARSEESFYYSISDPGKAPFGKHPDFDLLADKDLEECAELLVEGKLGGQQVTMNIWRPQVQWLTDRDEKLMVDYIGRVETMEFDLQQLKKNHGISSQDVSWLNKSEAKGEIPQFTERARDLVRLFYKRDFEMLGYDDELPARFGPRLPRCAP